MSSVVKYHSGLSMRFKLPDVLRDHIYYLKQDWLMGLFLGGEISNVRLGGGEAVLDRNIIATIIIQFGTCRARCPLPLQQILHPASQHPR